MSTANANQDLPSRGLTPGRTPPGRVVSPRLRLINRTISRRTAIALGALPFIVLIVVYAIGSHIRLSANPSDKLLPSFESMWAAFSRMATVPDVRTGDLTFWVDTFDSLQRLGLGLTVSIVLALGLGIAIGFLPHVRAGLAPFVSAISLIPPITILPILFIVFGLGETAKIALIAIGTAPVMIRSTAQAVIDLPREQLIKIQTLGASQWQMVTRMVLPQVLPRLITALRLSLIPAFIFLVSAEAIASTTGLGYRIFLVRRYLAMDVILPYVIWITLLAFLIDRLLLLISKRAFRWFHLEGESL